MLKKITALAAGFPLLFLGIAFGSYFFYMDWHSRDEGYTSLVLADTCSHPLEKVEISKSLLTENDSLSVTVYLRNPSAQECTAEVTLLAGGFATDPHGTEREINLPANDNARVIWLLSPTKLGAQGIGVSAGYDSWAHGISVVNTLGMTPTQAKLVSIVCTFLGPALTFPWLFQLWKKRREQIAQPEERKIILP